MKWIRKIWDYLGDENHRGRLAFFGGGFAVVIAYFIVPPPPPPPPPPIPTPCQALQSPNGLSHAELTKAIGDMIEEGYEQLGVLLASDRRKFRNEKWDPLYSCAKALLDQNSLTPEIKSQLSAFAAIQIANADTLNDQALKYAQIAIAENPKNPHAMNVMADLKLIRRLREITATEKPAIKKILEREKAFREALESYQISIMTEPTYYAYRQKKWSPTAQRHMHSIPAKKRHLSFGRELSTTL